MTKKKKNVGGRPQVGDIDKAMKMVDNLSTEADMELMSSDPYKGLTDRQQIIARFKLRGVSQAVMASFLNVSQPVVSKELQRIRKHLQEKGASIDQDLTVGETTSLYEEVEYKAWELYHSGDDATKAKALALVMSAREKHTKLLMDLGRLERAGNRTTLEVHHVSPLIRKMEQPEQKALVTAVINSQLSTLEEPSPPLVLEASIFDDDDDDDLT